MVLARFNYIMTKTNYNNPGPVTCDPGIAGGFAWVDLQGLVHATKMPSTDGQILSLLGDIEKQRQFIPGKELPKELILEDLVKYTGVARSNSSIATYGAGWGTIKGIAIALGYRLRLVKPQKWIKALGLGSSRGMQKHKWKSKLRGEAERLFPNVNVTLATADALLMLEAARKNLI